MKGELSGRMIDWKEVNPKQKAAFKDGLLRSLTGEIKSLRASTLVKCKAAQVCWAGVFFPPFQFLHLFSSPCKEVRISGLSGFHLLQHAQDIQVKYSKSSRHHLRPWPTSHRTKQLCGMQVGGWRLHCLPLHLHLLVDNRTLGTNETLGTNGSFL